MTYIYMTYMYDMYLDLTNPKADWGGGLGLHPQPDSDDHQIIAIYDETLSAVVG